MANNENASFLGRIKTGAFETVGRSESWAENRVSTVIVVGKAEDIADKVKPGDSMAQHSSWFGNKFNGNYYVRTVEQSFPDGVTGELKLSLVKCPQGKTQPFNVIWEVGMEEVQMRLINHPCIIKNASVETLLKWEDTPKGQRVVKKDGDFTFYYRDTWSGYQWQMGTITKKSKPWEYAYCLAVSQGVETWNRYLPVIMKHSTYLEMPGAKYSEDRIVTGGTISEFTKSDSIGRFDEPDLKVAGFNNKDGLWFKSGDKYTINADGTATRDEVWVFTNDPSHKWIYTHNLND